MLSCTNIIFKNNFSQVGVPFKEHLPLSSAKKSISEINWRTNQRPTTNSFNLFSLQSSHTTQDGRILTICFTHSCFLAYHFVLFQRIALLPSWLSSEQPLSTTASGPGAISAWYSRDWGGKKACQEAENIDHFGPQGEPNTLTCTSTVFHNDTMNVLLVVFGTLRFYLFQSEEYA